jgi:antitoxin VapB
MALYVKDPEVDQLATLLAERRNTTKTEVLKQALRRELERPDADPTLAEIGLEFARQFKAKGDPAKVLPVDKDYIDSLYE